MEEIRVAAKAYYFHNVKFKTMCDQFRFRLDREYMDRVEVTYTAFMGLVKERGRRCTSKVLYSELDYGNKEYLDADDVRVLLYLIETRIDCCQCGDLLRTVYYTCLDCFDNVKPARRESTYNLCHSCLQEAAYSHHHRPNFVDNYALIQKRRFRRADWEGAAKGVGMAAAGGLISGTAKGVLQDDPLDPEAEDHEGAEVEAGTDQPGPGDGGHGEDFGDAGYEAAEGVQEAGHEAISKVLDFFMDLFGNM
ncbi:uncharacterized protein LOC116187273 [Punica granatum]|uniref:Uncharacterized protein n=2 Tax=Punica granatum TaxID=22663 RepID=A0A218WMH1_PUNGR|nr:uncharacterized protein LOC116187273 [Punica granatum]OWM73846.1 hypothetical protein CDL15_Pgr018906 [Punica granatum]PKI66827.1 hypothetical protein CRG98_012833 [Punica granatum]